MNNAGALAPPERTFTLTQMGTNHLDHKPPAPEEMHKAMELMARHSISAKKIPYDTALAYADSFGPGGITARNVSGCYTYAGCGGLCVVCPTCVYQFPLSDDCVCGFSFLCGVPLLFPFCLCERKRNNWVTRDKHGIKTGEVVVVDREMGTHLCYGVQCCSSTMDEFPFCVARRCCEGKPVKLV
uniref:Uncharacterized protein n=1 Tax=Mantoniella antarctica TaxID=81844 RepID=A0A7S0S737_9CHLO|mmetsp:Transcript_10040/g.24720  ORF Transcript_10040/g.24720 Transcript_10040/m.24720 type:complete len:184 (+) Transcript_10040:177-728(+)